MFALQESQNEEREREREREREKGPENITEVITTENFPNLRKETDVQIHESQSPKQDQPKEEYTRHVVNKMARI